MEGLVLRGANVDLSSPAFNRSLPCWNIFLLNFNQKHKNRLFIIGKTSRAVSVLCLAKFPDASPTRLQDPKPAKQEHTTARQTDRQTGSTWRQTEENKLSLGQGFPFNMKIIIGKFDECCWTLKFLFHVFVWCSLWGLKWSIWASRTEKTKQQVGCPCVVSHLSQTSPWLVYSVEHSAPNSNKDTNLHN